MRSLIIDIVQVQAVLALAWVVYRLLLKPAGLFRFSRWYLAVAVVLASVAPFIVWPQATVLSYEIALPEITATATTPATATTIPWWNIAVGIYLAGMLGVTAWFAFSYRKLHQLLHQARPAGNWQPYYIIPGSALSFTYGRTIYLGEKLSAEQAHLILQHEMAHRNQWHAIDQALMILGCIIWWFNPIIWLLRNEVRANHEFLADEAVKGHIPLAQYYSALFEQATGAPFAFSHHFGNHSKTLKRIKMMELTTTTRQKWMTTAALIPLLGGMLWLSACEVQGSYTEEPEVTENTVPTQPDKMPEYEGGMAALAEDLTKVLVYPEAAKKNGPHGTVYVNLTIDETGNLTDLKVVEGVSEELDNAALNAVRTLTHWTPGTHNGQPVKVKLVLPVKFEPVGC